MNRIFFKIYRSCLVNLEKILFILSKFLLVCGPDGHAGTHWRVESDRRIEARLDDRRATRRRAFPQCCRHSLDWTSLAVDQQKPRTADDCRVPHDRLRPHLSSLKKHSLPGAIPTHD